MLEKEVTIRNKVGLHARPAGAFVQIAGNFKADIAVVKDGTRVNGKSIMGLMMLAAEKGSQLTIITDGPDETEALAALVALVDAKFDEE
ncbi:HPr family phosphocarrier protein [candidate division KSB1 bacterium]